MKQQKKTFDFWLLNKHIPDNLCDFMIQNFSDYAEGTIFSDKPDQQHEVKESVRNSDICWIDEPFWCNMFFDFIARVNVTSGLNFDITKIEPLQLTRYVAPHGHYSFHQDGNGYTEIGNGFPVRKLSLSCLLNDPEDFEGGQLEFFTGTKPYSVDLKKGDVVIFPSYQLHRVKPVTKGKRYSMVAWVSGPQFK